MCSFKETGSLPGGSGPAWITYEPVMVQKKALSLKPNLSLAHLNGIGPVLVKKKKWYPVVEEGYSDL